MNPYLGKNRGFITSSKLKEFMRCGFCYAQKYINEIEDPTEDRECFLIGQAVDDMVTSGPEKFKEQYAVCKRRLGKTEKIELTETMASNIVAMAKEFKENKLFAINPQKMVIEVKHSTLNLRAEFDDIDRENHLIRDIKTAASVTNFDPQNYLHQMSFYQFILEEKTGERYGAMLEIVDKYTYFPRSMAIQYTPETLMSYRGNIITALENLKFAHETGVFLPANDQKVLFNCPYYGLKTNQYPEGHGRQKEPLFY